MWNNFSYFTRTERQGILILAVLCFAVFAAGWMIPVISGKASTAANDTEKFEKKYAEFIASVRQKELKRYTYTQSFQPQRRVRLTTFDPNTTDSVGFLDLGLPAWMAKNILKYRNKGGKFRRAEDFRNVYGLTQEQYTTLLPYICIAPVAETHRDTLRLYIPKVEKEREKAFKYAAGTVIELNEADTTELKKIPGIGSAIARMITGYRSCLGGFYDIAQLKDIHLNVEKLRPWFTIATDHIQQLNINLSSVERLKAHPYINFYQAKAIVEHRKKRGILKSMKQLSLYEEFTPQDLERISHYVCFE